MLYYLIYASQAKTCLQTNDLLAILNSARIRNTEFDITGMLLYIQPDNTNTECGRFIQFLEGTESNVLELFELIKTDHRHENVILLNEGRLKTRNFKEWQMAFESIAPENLYKHAGYIELNSALFQNFDSKRFNFALNSLKAFYELKLRIA